MDKFKMQKAYEDIERCEPVIKQFTDDIRKEEDKLFYKSCLNVAVDPEALIKLQKEVNALRAFIEGYIKGVEDRGER